VEGYSLGMWKATLLGYGRLLSWDVEGYSLGMWKATLLGCGRLLSWDVEGYILGMWKATILLGYGRLFSLMTTPNFSLD
jgi:hypothetical protein